MKNHSIVLATLILSALSTSALANDARQNPTTSTFQAQSATTVQPQQIGKSREQVRQELLEAHRQGLIPVTEADYPPSQRTIDANKARHAILEQYWADSD